MLKEVEKTTITVGAENNHHRGRDKSGLSWLKGDTRKWPVAMAFQPSQPPLATLS